ncbi:hypothetical protein E2553_36060 [Paraburkholderia dipogonis]|uniref:Uncharacterized protein n=1 Tax=Paraburkholderia dipogonis TaxID=1211383 RepID=A0A4Y8MWU7_9BURK|nr:hypothetical protein [Paraburkholderia dipogonis]TFE42030.1 hypothetical protein E2553_36060 [Paraburkholderia dipogonis]
MTEVFAYGYVAWLTQRPTGFSLSGYIDGVEFDVIAQAPQQAERLFSRAARRAWLRRKFMRILRRKYPAREMVSSADVYYDVTVLLAIRVAISVSARALTRRICRHN